MEYSAIFSTNIILYFNVLKVSKHIFKTIMQITYWLKTRDKILFIFQVKNKNFSYSI